MSAFATVTRNILLEHAYFTRKFRFKLCHVSIAVANSKIHKIAVINLFSNILVISADVENPNILFEMDNITAYTKDSVAFAAVNWTEP